MFEDSLDGSKYIVVTGPWSWQWRWKKMRFCRGRFIAYRENHKTWAEWEWEDE